MEERLSLGTQVIYVPTHANGNKDHKDCAFGFATSSKKNGAIVFCRYWWTRYADDLRTKGNSEGCSPDQLVIEDYCDQSVIDAQVEILKEQGQIIAGFE